MLLLLIIHHLLLLLTTHQLLLLYAYPGKTFIPLLQKHICIVDSTEKAAACLLLFDWLCWSWYAM